MLQRINTAVAKEESIALDNAALISWIDKTRSLVPDTSKALGARANVENHLAALKDVQTAILAKEPEMDSLLPQLPQGKADALTNQWTALTAHVGEAMGDLETALQAYGTFDERYNNLAGLLERMEGQLTAVSKMKPGGKRTNALKVRKTFFL